MVKLTKFIGIFAMGLLFFICGYGNASAASYPAAEELTLPDNPTTETVPGQSQQSYATESLFPSKSKTLSFSHFTWGAEAGSSLDLTSNDLSTFDVDVLLGYKNKFIKLLGFGAGIHRSIHTGNNFIPVYAVIRTSFRSKPSLFFLNIQGGYSFNNIADSGLIVDFTSSLGLGINLQQTQVSKSYIIISACYQHFDEVHRKLFDIDSRNITFARLVIGVNF